MRCGSRWQLKQTSRFPDRQMNPQEKCIPSRNTKAKPIAPLFVIFFLKHPLINTKALRHEETSSKRGCRCTRGERRCKRGGEAARRPHSRCEVASQATRRGASCYTQRETREHLLLFFCVGFHCPARLWLGGTPPREHLPDFATLNA